MTERGFREATKSRNEVWDISDIWRNEEVLDTRRNDSIKE